MTCAFALLAGLLGEQAFRARNAGGCMLPD